MNDLRCSNEVYIALETSGKHAVVTVKRTGIGIPKANLADIFRPYRIDEAYSLTEGTGLGLSIAKWLSDTHRDELSVHNVGDPGTTFRISFRLAA